MRTLARDQVPDTLDAGPTVLAGRVCAVIHVDGAGLACESWLAAARCCIADALEAGGAVLAGVSDGVAEVEVSLAVSARESWEAGTVA